jgi:hypothetical protein
MIIVFKRKKKSQRERGRGSLALFQAATTSVSAPLVSAYISKKRIESERQPDPHMVER